MTCVDVLEDLVVGALPNSKSATPLVSDGSTLDFAVSASRMSSWKPTGAC